MISPTVEADGTDSNKETEEASKRESLDLMMEPAIAATNWSSIATGLPLAYHDGQGGIVWLRLVRHG